jgi:hypothetical protein
MYAEDDRYASSFLFTEDEVRMLCESHNTVCNAYRTSLLRIQSSSLVQHPGTSLSLQRLHSANQHWVSVAVQPVFGNKCFTKWKVERLLGRHW